MPIISTLKEETEYYKLFEDLDEETNLITLREEYKVATPEERKAALEDKIKATAIELRTANTNWATLTDAQKIRTLRDLYRGYINLVQYVFFDLEDDEGV